MLKGFKCCKCGLCCKSLNKNHIYGHLHDGNGVCKYFDLNTNLCTIYENRPILCNIDLSYELYFNKEMPKEVYYALNYKGCRNIWEKNKKREKK